MFDSDGLSILRRLEFYAAFFGTIIAGAGVAIVKRVFDKR